MSLRPRGAAKGSLADTKKREGKTEAQESVQNPSSSEKHRCPLIHGCDESGERTSQAAPLPRNCSPPILSQSRLSGLSRPSDANAPHPRLPPP